MDAELILTVLKYAGTVIGGIAGIWGITKETYDGKTRKLTTWGRLALSLAVAAFSVAIGARIIEQIQTARAGQAAKDEAKAVKAKADKTEADLKEQLRVAKASLAALDGSRTRFDRMSLTAYFELPTSEASVKNFTADLGRLVAQNTGPDGKFSFMPGVSMIRERTIWLMRNVRAKNDPRLETLLANHKGLFALIDVWQKYSP